MAEVGEIDVENIIKQLLSAKKFRPGKLVNSPEADIRWLDIKSREIFTAHPVLFEQEVSIYIRGINVIIILNSMSSAAASTEHRFQ